MQRVGEHKIVAAYECNDIERPHFSSRNGGVFDCGRQSVCSGVDTYFGRHSTCKKTDSLMSVVLVGFTLPSGNVRQKRREAKNESK